jgi:dolichyl-phosphate beta-glucosyltransferase
MDSLSIILPSYNEETRLPRTFSLLDQAIAQGVFKGVKLEQIFVVDDGSRDHTARLVSSQSLIQPLVKLIEVKPNQGKGNAIHEGLRASTTSWCLVADADSATPWDQFLKLHRACTDDSGNRVGEVAIGSRDLPESNVTQKQSWIRENMGRTFNVLVRLITGLPYRDTQCGFKLIYRPHLVPFLSKLEVKRFAWDVEFLMFAKKFGLRISEVPVNWEHQDASRVNAIKDSSEMLFRVIQLRWRLLFTSKEELTRDESKRDD